MLASSTCWCWWWSSVHNCRLSRVPLLYMFHCIPLVKRLRCCYVLAWYLLLMLVVMLCFWEVCTCDVHVSQYAMLSWIWFIVDIVDSYVVCWYHAHAFSLHHVILSWLRILHSSLTGLNWTWTTVGWVMVPPYRTDQCNHAYLYGKVLTWSIVVPLAGASN